MNNITALVFTLLLGLFLMIGAFIVFLTKNTQKIVNFSIGLAFGVMITLTLSDLLPESIDLIGTKYDKTLTFFIVFIGLLLGLFLLKLLDKFIPDHETDDDENQLLHIGIVSSIALVLHNIIEGMTLFATFISSYRLGILLSIGVGLHNIPLGMTISSTFYKTNKDKKKTFFLVLLISLSTFIGGLVMLFFSGIMNDYILGILLSITLGMIIYIVIFELLPHIIETKDKKISISGVIVGMLLLIISHFFH